jgi:hypothetical protein
MMQITYSPLHTILAAGVLLIIPVVFHLIAFRKSIRFIHILTSILVGNFILAFVAEIAGLAHFFDAKIILLLSLLIAGVSGYWINKKGIFYKENITGNNISKTSILLVMGFAIFIFLYQKNTFPPFTPDTFAGYLSWARIIVNEGAIPAFHLETNSYYTIHLPPLLYINIAFLFSLFGEYIGSIAAAIPLIYLCLFVFMITNWGEEYVHAGRGVSLLILLSLLLAPSTNFLYLGSRVLQEAPLLFFATASFYLLFKYLRTKETIFLVLLSISSALMSLTKYSGLMISAILFCMLIIVTRDKKEIQKIFVIFPLIHIPNILWAIRNLYFFNNPVYPAFGSIFKNIYLGPAPILPIEWGYQYSFPEMFALLFITFPAFIFTIFYMFRNRRNVEVQYVITCFIIFLVILYISRWRLLVRYLYPFLGIFALYAGIEMSKLYDKISIDVIKKKKKVIITIAIILCCMMSIMIPTPGIHLSDIKSGNYKSVMSDLNLSDLDPREPHISSETVNKLRVLEYLQNNEKEKDLIIIGYDSDIFIWYGHYTALYPIDSSFIVLNYKVNKEPFDFTKNSAYIYNNLKKMDVDYIYACGPPCPVDEMLFDKINQDPEHFELVYDKNGYRLWKIK